MRCYCHIVAGLAGFYFLAAVQPALAQASKQTENREVVLSAPNGTSCRSVHGRFKGFERRQRMMEGRIKGRRLPLTGCEVWSMPRAELGPFKEAAGGRGAVITELGSDWQKALRPAPGDMRLGARQKRIIELTGAAKATVGVKVMMGPPPPVLEHMLTRDAGADNARISVALGDGSTRTIVRSGVDLRPDMVIWRGTTEETGGTVTLIWWPSGKMAGTIQSQGRLYAIRHLGGRIYAVVEMNVAKMPEEHAPMPERLRTLDPSLRDDPLVRQGEAGPLRDLMPAAVGPAAAPRSRPPPKLPATEQRGASAPAAEIVIDVLVAYTRKAASHYDDIRRELIDLSIEEANHAFRISGLGHVKLRLAHAYQTDYVEDGSHFEHLYRMVDRGDGHMEDIHALRDKHRADVVVLVVDDAQGCGLATRVHADADEAFAVVHHVCSAATYSLAHEVGHLIGARHEVTVDPSMLPFRYGHGHVNGTKWRDIMSYKASCGGCPRLPVWSNPNVVIRGEPAGSPEANNARVIAEEAARVAAFR